MVLEVEEGHKTIPLALEIRTILLVLEILPIPLVLLIPTIPLAQPIRLIIRMWKTKSLKILKPIMLISRQKILMIQRQFTAK